MPTNTNEQPSKEPSLGSIPTLEIDPNAIVNPFTPNMTPIPGPNAPPEPEGEPTTMETVYTKESVKSSASIKSSVKDLFQELETALDWNNEPLPTELEKFLKTEMQANDTTIKFFERNSLITIRDIAFFGTKDINAILEMFPNHHDDGNFLHSLTIIHHLAEFFKATGEDAKTADTALLATNPSSPLDYLPDNEEATNTFIKNIKTTSLKRQNKAHQPHLVA